MRTKLFHTVVVVGAALVSGLGAAACSGDADEEPGAENGTATPNDAEDGGADAALREVDAEADAGWHPTK